MKRTVLIYTLFTVFSFLAISDAFAQTDASRSKSRLNMGKKPAESVSSSLTKIPSSLDRSIKLRPSSAINAFYRSVMLNPTTGNSTATTSKIRTNKELSTPVASETRPNLEDAAKSEDLLFVSDKLRVLNAFPNPANDYTEIDYQVTNGIGTTKIALFNVIGNNVAEYDLDRNERQLRIQTREMPTGVYFYRLILDGKAVATKKLLIRH